MKVPSLVCVAGICALSMVGCSVLEKTLDHNDYFNSHFTGFALYDPASGEYLHEWNSHNHFTPASNTKLLSFYTGLKLLPDSVPQLIYQIEDDSLFFTSTGDPTFLHYRFDYQPGLALLQDTTKVLVYVPQEFVDTPYAPGWAWEDYEYYYQPERSAFPIYGNVVSFAYDSLKNLHRVQPQFFNEFTEILSIKGEKNRAFDANVFTYKPDTAKSTYRNSIPFITSDELVVRLLVDTLKQAIDYREFYSFDDPDTVRSIPSLDYYAYMLKTSDNLFAEQLMFLCATETGMAMNFDEVKNLIRYQYFQGLTDLPTWRDGSGLSRYNLVTPAFMIQLLDLIYLELSMDRMKALLSIGGIDGTLKDWYKEEDGQPYVFAKTGTLSNNHSLTGIIRTRSGRDLFFSFMNNNYPTGSAPVKEKMKEVLEIVRDRY